MKTARTEIRGSAVRRRAMTLVELMVAVGLSGIVLALLASLFVSSLANFAGLGNYAILTGQSRLSLDRMSQEMRESSRVLGWQTNLPVKWILLTNSIQGTTIKYQWDSSTGIVTSEKPGVGEQVLLTGCDAWDFSVYQRTAQASWGFYATTNPAVAKLINMSWKCSRTILGKKINTETVVTSQVVLRNKM